jgi:hypothetical protein
MPDTPTLPLPQGPLPSTMPGMPPQGGQDPSKVQRLLQLLKSLGPMISPQQQQLQQQQPQQIQAVVPQFPQTHYDPTSTVGSLPKPVEQPMTRGFEASPGSAEIMSKLDPQGAAVFSGVQGVTKFLQDSFQRKDEKQHAEAANAAKALMDALEGAKTSGDFTVAQHVFENNEQLFNKVFKGWMQKAEEAKKPQKKQKVDPEVQGFEKALSEYPGRGGNPPKTLMGKSGAQYFMPQAAPQQAINQQQQSSIMQAQKQGAEYITPEERVKLQEANLKLQETQTSLERSHLDLKIKETELKKAQTDAEAKGTDIADLKILHEQQTQTLKDQLALTEQRYLDAAIKKDTQIEEIKRRLGGPKHTEADDRKLKSVEQIYGYLNDMISQGKPFKANDISAIQGMLSTVGASTYAKALPKVSWWSSSKPEDVSVFKDKFDKYVDALNAGINKGQSKDSSKASSDKAIVVTPEDMK